MSGPKRFDISNPQSPYVISQQDGAYFSIPDFLHSAHTDRQCGDAEAYLSRLAQFATVLDNETAEAAPPGRARFPGAGLVARPRAEADERASSAGRRTKHDGGLRSPSRAAAKNIAGDWRARAAKIVADQVYPALDRQIAAVTALRADHAAG